MLELVQFTSTHLCGNLQYYRMKNAATGITIYSLLCLLPCAVNNEQVPMRLWEISSSLTVIMQTHSNEETIRFLISSPQSGRDKVRNTYDINHI